MLCDKIFSFVCPSVFTSDRFIIFFRESLNRERFGEIEKERKKDIYIYMYMYILRAVTSEHWIQRERNCKPSRGARPTQRVSLSLEIQCSEVTVLSLSLSLFFSLSVSFYLSLSPPPSLSLSLSLSLSINF